jgi:hypothetical protein
MKVILAWFDAELYGVQADSLLYVSRSDDGDDD